MGAAIYDVAKNVADLPECGKLNQKDNKKNSESFSGILSQHCIKDKQIEAKGVKYIARNNPNPSL